MKTQKVVSKKEMMEEMKKYQVLKWTAEVELDEDGNIIECEYINICYPDAKKYDIIKARVQNDLDDLAQDYLNEKYNQEALHEYRK